MNYYLGAYHLIRLKPLDFGKFKGQKVLTGSRCLNESFYDAWSLSWGALAGSDSNEIKEEFNISDYKIKEIQKWADIKFNNKQLGWINTFNNFETLIEYKTKFFNDVSEFKAIGIYFPENSIQNFIEEFEPKPDTTGAIGMLDCLMQKIQERIEDEVFVGYDLIGVELEGNYHSFHCYDIFDDLSNRFKLSLNEKGLLNDFDNKEEVLKYVNNPDSGLCYGPWYLVKVNEVKIKST